MNSRILQVRKYLNLSQKEFGNSLGVSRDVIANYENGRVIPPNSIINLSLPFPATDDKIDIRKGGRQSFTETCGEDSKREKDT